MADKGLTALKMHTTCKPTKNTTPAPQAKAEEG